MSFVSPSRFWLALATLALAAPVRAQPAKPVDVLRIGTSGSLALDASGGKREAALENLRNFIKTETGFDNELIQQKDIQELAARLADGRLNLGVFQGYEFAWAQEKYPKLRPLALAVKVYPYRHAYVLVRQDNKATDFAGLKGQTLALPQGADAHLRLYAERQAENAGQPLNAFFAKVTTPANVEDALDDVVDNIAQVTVVDRAGLEAFKRRKPGRFARLKELAQSEPFPPPLVAYAEGNLDPATLRRFQQGLVTANKKATGQQLLTLFKLTGFLAPPDDFAKVVAATQKAYPARNGK